MRFSIDRSMNDSLSVGMSPYRSPSRLVTAQAVSYVIACSGSSGTSIGSVTVMVDMISPSSSTLTGMAPGTVSISVSSSIPKPHMDRVRRRFAFVTAFISALP